MATTAGLRPAFRPWADFLLKIARQYLSGSFRLTSAVRDQAEQARLYQRYVEGQSDLPAAPPGRSYHQLGLAVDIARPGVDPKQDELLGILGAWWRSQGGVWNASDPVHFQAPERMRSTKRGRA